MKIDYRKRFLKELSKIPTEIRSSIESFVFKELPKANRKTLIHRIAATRFNFVRISPLYHELKKELRSDLVTIDRDPTRFGPSCVDVKCKFRIPKQNL